MDLQAVTEFFIWLVFITTLAATSILIMAGSIQLIAHGWAGLASIAGAIITLSMHYGIRQMPVTKKRKTDG